MDGALRDVIAQSYFQGDSSLAVTENKAPREGEYQSEEKGSSPLEGTYFL